MNDFDLNEIWRYARLEDPFQNFLNDENEDLDFLKKNDSTKNDSKISKKERIRLAGKNFREKKAKKNAELFAECDFHAQRNAELKKMIRDCEAEILTVKKLLLDVYVSKKLQ